MSSLNPFQWIALSGLIVILLVELYVAFRSRVHRGFWVVRVVIWFATGVAIYQPQNLTRLAELLGIERGADLVLYFTVLLFFTTSLFLYARYKQLQRQITTIVRHIAIREARYPNRSANASLPEGE